MKVLISAAGYQGGYNLVKHLQEEGIEVIGTDLNKNSAAKFYCDKFYPSPAGSSKKLIPFLMDICLKEKVDVILPASSTELYQLALNKDNFEDIGTKVLVSDPELIRITLNKYLTYEKLKGVIDLPQYIYSEEGMIAKPMMGKGSRGIEVIDKPFLMEKLSGEALDVDTLSWKGELLVCIVKKRERAYGGTIMEGEIVNRPEIVETMRKILRVLPLDYVCVSQFIRGKLLEINPRIPGGIIYQDWNLPSLAIKLALGSLTPEQIKEYQYKISYGRRVARYMTQIEF